MNKKIKISLILFWLLVIGSLLYWLNTTHWEVYKNQEYGFMLSFPENFRIKTDPYSTNDSTHFDFIVVSPDNAEYLKVRAYNKPSDYKEPSGPFPKVTSNEKFGATTNSYVFNGINGFRTEGTVEGGGGSFDYFEFIHGSKVWEIEFLAEEGNYPEKTFEKKVYSKIRDSFELI